MKPTIRCSSLPRLLNCHGSDRLIRLVRARRGDEGWEGSMLHWMTADRLVRECGARPVAGGLPPPDVPKYARSFATSRTSASTSQSIPRTSRAPVGHASAHRPQASHFAGSHPWGQTSRHAPQSMHRSVCTTTSGRGDRLSGLWHHMHRSGQPFRNTVVRIPGPSSVDMR